jgi:hypothetical protein
MAPVRNGIGLYGLVRFLNGEVVFLGAEERIELKQLRAEITNDVITVIEVLRDAAFDKAALGRLEQLIDKINGLRLNLRLSLMPTSKMFFSSGKPTPFYEQKPGLKIADQKWVVRTSFGHSSEEIVEPTYQVLRQYHYGLVAETLQNWDFVRLGRCPECNRFFILSRSSQKFCEIACTKAADQKAAITSRVPKFRREQKNKKIRQAVQAAESEAFRHFSEFVAVARKSNHSDGELLKLRPILRGLGNGSITAGWKVVKEWQEELKAQGSLEKLWTRMRTDHKKAFTKAATSPYARRQH